MILWLVSWILNVIGWYAISVVLFGWSSHFVGCVLLVVLSRLQVDAAHGRFGTIRTGCFANSSRQTVEGMYFHVHTLILTLFSFMIRKGIGQRK